jgi:signal transduction histidine kinase
MGFVTIVSIISTYLIASHYAGPEIVIASVSITTIITLTIGYLVVKSLSYIAQINQLKSEFVSIVSHQLRAPLSSLRWALEVFLKTDPSENQKKYLKLMQESNERMLRLVNDLLNVSRIEQGRLSLRKEKINLAKIIKEVIKEFHFLAKASNVEISFRKEGDLPPVLADEDKIRMVIQNLLSNALQYSRGRGEITIRLRKQKDNLLFEISDTGVGIPKKQQKRIFEKFFRANNVLKYQTKGTGLGLFIAKAIIDNSGGKIWFKSKEGKGSTFYFTLPIVSDN